MKNLFKVLMTFSVLAALVAPTFADDIYPPAWRGLPGTTRQIWEFSTPDPAPMPDPVLSFNPNGLSAAQVTPKLGDVWRDVVAGEQGVWPLSGEIVVPINNFPQLNPDKFIWIQLTWKAEEQAPLATPFISELEHPLGQVVTELRTIPLPEPNKPGWKHSTYQITLHPNPVHEMVMIAGEIYVSELVIDTHCVPEPSALILLVMGAFGAAFVYIRRWRA